ncbi:hypothetical protein PLEOSDRAFT_170106 [Pleurotus ostreatus PC15]|uniref:Uncharacterized protein n=1 Tax=Pleurotus ostreatus (strain PC15) TaxID=1137138 RepID=A0A067NMY3_PLEO1|nr:hypothetical protein PLEOSDRAFT_170106 [Pleurotus ostreatus PC15]
MATTANVPTKPLSIIPAALTKNGTFFRNQYIIVFDPYLSSNPFPIHPDDAILAGLNNYCDFTLLNNLPADFDIQYDTKLDKWVQLVNPPPHTNIILIETMRNITSRLIYKVIMEASNIPISSSDLIFHPRLGVGIAQGINYQPTRLTDTKYQLSSQSGTIDLMLPADVILQIGICTISYATIKPRHTLGN